LTDLFLGKLTRDISHESGRITSWNLNANNCDEIVVKIVLRKSNGKILFDVGKADFADYSFRRSITFDGRLFLCWQCGWIVDLDEY